MEDKYGTRRHQFLKTLLGGEKEALELLGRAYVHSALYVAPSELIVEAAVDYDEVGRVRALFERTRLALELMAH